MSTDNESLYVVVRGLSMKKPGTLFRTRQKARDFRDEQNRLSRVHSWRIIQVKWGVDNVG